MTWKFEGAQTGSSVLRLLLDCVLSTIHMNFFCCTDKRLPLYTECDERSGKC